MIQINGSSLTLDDIYHVACQNKPVSLSKQAKQAMGQSQGWVEEIVQQGKPVYGINTGFGVFADRQISGNESRQLNRNLILSHAVGVGDSLPNDVVRAAMLIRANTLAKGYSGVRSILVETILEMLNQGIVPVIPSQGSLGSSGDLAPLSHLGLVLSTDQEDLDQQSGYVECQGQKMSGKTAMEKAGIPRIILEAKEGIALTNGATFSTAMAALICIQAKHLLLAAEMSFALSLEALLGVSSAYDQRIHKARQHPGQIEVANNIRKLIQGSTLLDSTARIQDAYSLRCSPQVHGPAREILTYSTEVISREINAATDNPLIFGKGEAISGGNFHGEPIGFVMDFLGIALTEIAGISERRIYRLTDGKLNENLPSMLVDTPEDEGLNSGMMMPHYTAAALVLENRTLATPDSIHSLPTSGSQEDHNANSLTAARHCYRILNNTIQVIAIELYIASRAIYIRLRDLPQAKPGKGTAAVFKCISDKVEYHPKDTLWGPEIEQVKELMLTGDLYSSVEKLL